MINYIKQFFKRFFHIHDYSIWSEFGSGPLVDEKGRKIGTWQQQKRTCKICNYVQIVENQTC